MSGSYIYTLVSDRHQGSPLAAEFKNVPKALQLSVLFESIDVDFMPSPGFAVMLIDATANAGVVRSTYSTLKKYTRSLLLVLHRKRPHVSVTHFQTMALETDAATNVLPVDSLLEAVRYVATLAHQEARPAKPHTSALAQGRKTKDQSQAMQIIACFRTCPGVGEKKAGELAAVFKSVESLANASEDAVAAVVGKATAKRIVLFFNDPIWDNGSGRTLSAANKVGIQV